MNLESVILIHKSILSCMIFDIITNIKVDNNFFKQLTIWNLFSLFFDPMSKIVLMNNIIIFILFHSCFILEPNLMTIIPEKCNLTVNNFHIVNIVLHILPFIYSIYMITNYKIVFEIQDVLDNIVFSTCWQIYVNFDYSLYSISKQYYFNLYVIYYSCLVGFIIW